MTSCPTENSLISPHNPHQRDGPQNKNIPNPDPKSKNKVQIPILSAHGASKNSKVQSSSNQEEQKTENYPQWNRFPPPYALDNSRSSRQIGDPQLHGGTSQAPNHSDGPPATTSNYKRRSPTKHIGGIKGAISKQLHHPK